MRIRNAAVSMMIGLSLVGGLSACGMKPDPIPAYATNTSGGLQTLSPGAQSAPLVVTVRDQDKDPIEGVEVTWKIESGAGTLSAASSTTNGDGVASVLYTAGSTTGATRIQATVPAVASTVSYTITVK